VYSEEFSLFRNRNAQVSTRHLFGQTQLEQIEQRGTYIAQCAIGPQEEFWLQRQGKRSPKATCGFRIIEGDHQ
jgi:hypothetical protein